MANYSAQLSDDVIRILTEARVCVITFAPHKVQVFQVLDLALFAVLSGVRGMTCHSMTMMRGSNA
jgi:hypothetical protein